VGEYMIEEFARTHGFQIEDFSDRNGHFWILTDDRDREVSNTLSSWGFHYRSDKGWWR